MQQTDSELKFIYWPKVLKGFCAMSLSACQEGEATLQSDLIPPCDTKGGLLSRADQLMSALQADGLAIATYLLPESEDLICLISRGEVAPSIGSLLDVNSGISGRCIRENRLLHSYDTKLDPRVDQDVCERMEIRSLAIIPLHRDAQCIGVLEVFSKRPAAFEGPNLTLLAEEAISIASSIPTHAELKASAMRESDRSNIQSEHAADEKLAKPSSSASSEASSEGVPSFIFRTLEGNGSSETHRFSKRYLPWIAASAAAVVVGFMAPRFVSQLHDLTSLAQKKTEVRVQSTQTADSLKQPVIPPAGTLTTAVPDQGKASQAKLESEAKAGNPMAQFFLAVHYLNRNERVAAAAWYIMSGTNGNKAGKQAGIEITRKLTTSEIANTRFQVGKMFLDGVGTPRDLISAYSWFALAKVAGDPRAGKEIQALSRAMTQDQLTQAQLRASRWLTSHGVKPQISENRSTTNIEEAR